METQAKRQQLHRFIDSIDDDRVEDIFTFLENEMYLEKSRKKLIASERENYLNNIVSSYSWETVKKMARNKKLRSEL